MDLTTLQTAAALALGFLAAASSAQEPPRSSGSVLLPLSEQTNWQVLQYRNLPPHRIRFSKAGLEMMVAASAMPLIYPLPASVRVTGIRVRGRVDGALRIAGAAGGGEAR